jgi:hypothetical protein
MGGSQGGVGLQASPSDAVGGGAQQPIGLSIESLSLGCTRSEVVNDKNGVFSDERQALIEICRARLGLALVEQEQRANQIGFFAKIALVAGALVLAALVLGILN